MPSSAVRVLELQFRVDTTQFNTAIAQVTRGLLQVRQAMGQLGAMGITISNSFNSNVSNAFNRTSSSIKNMTSATHQATKGFGSFFMSTQGGFRVFGAGGSIIRMFALVRNQLLLLAFGFGPVIYGFKEAVKASVEFTNAMTGLGAIARSTGQDINATQGAAKDLAAKGFMTVSESAMGLKNLLATGFGLEDAMKVMKGFSDSAAFNRQASFQWGEAVVRATEGIRLGLCIAEGSLIYDASTNNYKKVEDLFDECMDEDKKLITLGYDIDKNDFISVQASHITYNGVKPIYKIKTSSGKEVEATENHRFLTKDGYKLLKDLKVNDILIGMDNHSTINKKPKKEIKCKNCDIYFLPSNGREYLCLDCKTVICKQCGKNFIVKPKFLKTAHFCSKDCLANWQSENMSGFNSPVTKHGDSFTLISLVCKNCGVEYQRTKKWLKNNKSSFCSFECKKEWQKGKTARKFFTSVIRKCETCGKEVTVKNCHKDTFRFCSKNCRAVWQSEVLMNKENNPNWGGGTTEGRKVLEGRKEYRKWKNAVKKRDLLVCQNCGIEFNLHVHHIFHYKNYPDRVYDISNGITLCQSCHIQAHQVNRTFNKTEETIFSIEYVGEKRTYDLSVPETRNFVVNGLVSHNSNVADACFVYTTPILTDKGIVSIGDIVEKNLDVAVYSYDFKKKKVIKKKIINRFNNGEKEVYRITTESGKSFIATGNHRFYTLDGSKKELLEFNIGEELVLWEHQENSAPINILSGDKVLSIEFEGTAITYNITVEEFHNYFVGSDNTFILSSNSGVTKNLSQILVEQGKSMQDVSKISSDASVRQALLNGLMKEFTLYAGNADLALNNYSGSVSVLSTSLFNLKKEVGDALITPLSKLVKSFTGLVKEGTSWYRVNKDIMALKFDKIFSTLAAGLKDMVVHLAKATLWLVDFAATNKNLLILIVSLVTIKNILSAIVKLQGVFLGGKLLTSLKSVAGLWVGLKSTADAMAALTLSAEALLGPIGIIMAVLTALGLALVVWKNRQEKVTEALLENNAMMMKQTRIHQEYLELRKKSLELELDMTRARIKAGDSSVFLASKEYILTEQIKNLGKETLDATLQLEKFGLAQAKIKLAESSKKGLETKYDVSGYRPARAYGGTTVEKLINPLGGMMNQLDPEGLYRRFQAAKVGDVGEWNKIFAEAEKGFKDLTRFGAEAYSTLNKDAREYFDNNRSFYAEMARIADIYRAHEIQKTNNTTKELTDAQKAAINRFDEAIRKLKQDTDELNQPRGVPREVEEAQNRIEDIMKLGKEAGKSAEELDKLKNTFYQYIAAVGSDVFTKELTKNLEEFSKQIEDLAKEMRSAEEVSKDLFGKARERGAQEVDILINRMRSKGIGGSVLNILGIAPEQLGGKTKLRELDIEQEQEVKRLNKQRNESLKIYKEYYSDLYGLNEEYQKKADELNKLTEQSIYMTNIYYAAKQAEEKQKEIEDLAKSLNNIMNQVSTQVQNVANAYWAEREEIKRARDGELEDLRRQLSQGNIETQEYMARRNQIMMNANIQMANATKNAWRQAGQTAFDTMGQMLSQYVAKVAAAKMQTNLMMGLGMSALGGLGVGLLIAGGSYLLSKAFAETPTQDYQDIYPSGGTTAEERKRYGSLSAAPVQYINITPTVSFENVGGGQIFIGSGSVSEFSDEVSQVIKETVNAAIAGNEIMLDGISPR